MIALCCLLAVLIASGPTHGQLTCATLPDPPGNPCIEHNETTQDIYAPLYPSDSTVIVVFEPGDDTRIDVRFDVEIYMDCSGLITQMEGGAPSTDVIYFLQTVEQDAAVVTAGMGGRDTREFFGDNNMEILRIRNVSYATGAVGGSQGRYYCYACPTGTPVTVADIEACDRNATVLVTVLEDLPRVCTGSNDDTLGFILGEVPVKPGRDYVCLTEDPNPGPNDFALIEGMLDPGGEFNNLQFICELAPGLSVPGHVATASFNGEDIFSGLTVFPNTALCPTDDLGSEVCGVYQLNDDLSIGQNIGITNTDIEMYYGVYTCTITVADLDVTDSASVIASNCAPPTIASEAPQTNPSNGTLTIGSFACTGSTLSCPVEVSTGTPVNITWRFNDDVVEFISTAGAQTVMIMADTPGTYTCNATSHFGSAEVSSDVVAPPTIDSSAAVLPGTSNGCSRITGGGAFDACPAVNDMVGFDCDYNAAVPSNIQSLAGDVVLYNNNDMPISTTVTFTSSDQAGTYSCRTQTAVCGDISRQDLVVSVHAAPQIISSYTGLSAADLGVTQISVVGQNVMTDIAEGNSIALLCPSTGITQPTVQWTFNGSPIDNTNPPISQRTDQTDSSIQVSILTITNVMSSDDAIYGCTASNNVISAAVSASVNLNVQAAPGPDLTITIIDSVGTDVSATSCDRIDPMPAGVQACPLVGERVVISCVSNPVDLVVVTLHIPPSDAAHTQNSITASSIQEGGNIPDGQYSCRSNGQADSGTLRLYDPPQIFVNYMPTALLTMQLMATQVFVVGSSGTMNFVMGDSLALVCPYTGIPQPTVQWTHNGTAVDASDPRITILQQTDPDDASLQLSILNITALMSSDIGNYRCTASNVAGEAAQSLSLGEVEAPKPVLTITITDSFGRDWSTTSCSRIDPRPTDIDVCPLVGETVVISCVSSPPGSEVSLRIPPSNTEHTEDQIAASSIQEGGNIPNGVYSCQLNGEADSGTLRLYEPPSIDRNAPPPDPPVVPGGGEVEDVARLQGDAIPIQEGANAILFFPFTGMDATARFFRLEGDTRVEITDATPGYMIIQDPASQGIFLVVTNFTSGDAGTYEFVASNAAGTVSTTATLIVERDNVWVATPWSTCEPDCHKGERVRQVVCREMPGKVLQPDNECDPPKPPTVELCVNRGPCYLVPQWAHGDWSECSQPCGGGYRERDIFCIVPRTGALVDHSNCYAHSTPPSSFEYCNLHPCCTKDLYSEWCKLIRGTSFCAISPYYDVYCCWSCSGAAV